MYHSAIRPSVVHCHANQTDQNKTNYKQTDAILTELTAINAFINEDIAIAHQ